MAQITEFFNQNWIGAVIGLVGIFIGILGTVLVGYVFSPRSRLAARVNTLQIVGPNAALPGELEFVYKGARVPKVTLSRIAIWNTGNTTLRGDQIVSTDALRIVTSDDSQVLEATVLSYTRHVNGFSCVLRSENEIVCNFDFLDPRDGVLLQLIHTGDDQLAVLGTLRGLRKKIEVMGVPESPTRNQHSVAVNVLIALGKATLVLLIIIALAGVSLLALFGILIEVYREDYVSLAIFSGLIILLLAGGIIVANRFGPPSKLNPQITTIESEKTFWGTFKEWLRISPPPG